MPRKPRPLALSPAAPELTTGGPCPKRAKEVEQLGRAGIIDS